MLCLDRKDVAGECFAPEERQVVPKGEFHNVLRFLCERLERGQTTKNWKFADEGTLKKLEEYIQ